MSNRDISSSMEKVINQVAEKLEGEEKLIRIFERCYWNTLKTTIRRQKDSTTYIITGDIPAMWLRDSAAQVRPYLTIAKENEEMADIIEGVVKKQLQYIVIDPYANAFNETANGKRWDDDLTEMNDWLWERKYEIDSLCYPIQLAYLLWKVTGRTSFFDDTFKKAIHSILKVWEDEQDHEKNSKYSFQRKNCPPTDTLSRNGLGEPVKRTGMTWSGFRPSDDACQYGYLIPSNIFAVVVLGYIIEIADKILNDDQIAKRAEILKNEIDSGIKKHAIISHEKYGEIYAYETDGMGNYNLMDDANVPSLLSIPYLDYCKCDDPIYLNTRKFLLSEDNPYFYKGKVAEGIGSPHTPENFIWHISLAIEGLTAESQDEKLRIIKLMEKTDAGTDRMHEGFHVDDPNQFTRAWFSWANAMYCELVLDYCGLNVG
ncbi:glycoside hydrolase family 125 protein [Vallitalea okinawensis]|uniref:glycoside hydrolase family 125 protein n=1 Tax=Vallitalea okinawensis TaxID=2078660 RepID=UPI000CFBF977|nr:glycoside hydrolase family 125 protein [Vallitalea okinawensis]